MKTIAYKGLCIDLYHHKDEEARPVVCMIPGGSGKEYKNKDGKSFTGYADLAIKLFGAGFSVALFDAHGQGLSKKGRGYSCPNAEKDLDDVIEYVKTIDGIDSKKIGLWGRSGGAIIATHYIVNHHREVKSLVLWGCPMNMIHYYQPPTIDKFIKRLEDQGIIIDSGSISQTWNFENMVQEIRVPFLFTVNSEDPYFQRERIADFLKPFPQNTMWNFLMLSGVGHAIDRHSPQFEFYLYNLVYKNLEIKMNKEKVVYQREGTVKIYEESHYIPEPKKKEIAKDILDKISANSNTDGVIKIL